MKITPLQKRFNFKKFKRQEYSRKLRHPWHMIAQVKEKTKYIVLQEILSILIKRRNFIVKDNMNWYKRSGGLSHVTCLY